MNNDFIAKAAININATPVRVWGALTDPVLIKQYLFGTTATSDWKEGSPITYKGVWKGKEYEDKGKVIKVIPEKLLGTTYWSGLAGLPDIPENYKNVVYEITVENGMTRLTITQDGNATEEAKNESQKNWEMVLDSMKKLLENKATS